MKRIIETHTNKGDVVLDPFMGSGSTGVAANELERESSSALNWMMDGTT